MRIIDKIFRDKKGNSVIYLLLTIGVLLIIAGGSFKSSSPAKLEEEHTGSLQEERLSAVLSQIEGVGDVQVMISMETGDSGIFGEDSKQRNVNSVLIVAEGGDNPHIKEKILRAAKAALGVEIHKIEVLKGRKDNDDGG